MTAFCWHCFALQVNEEQFYDPRLTAKGYSKLLEAARGPCYATPPSHPSHPSSPHAPNRGVSPTYLAQSYASQHGCAVCCFPHFGWFVLLARAACCVPGSKHSFPDDDLEPPLWLTDVKRKRAKPQPGGGGGSSSTQPLTTGHGRQRSLGEVAALDAARAKAIRAKVSFQAFVLVFFY
jgi:hypothetical protein